MGNRVDPYMKRGVKTTAPVGTSARDKHDPPAAIPRQGAAEPKKNYESPSRTPGTKFVYSGAIDDTDAQILRIAQVLLKTVLKAVLRPVFG